MHDQRCPEVMPSLESWNSVFPTGPSRVRNSSQEPQLSILSHSSELLQLKKRQCHGFPVSRVAAQAALLDFPSLKNRV